MSIARLGWSNGAALRGLAALAVCVAGAIVTGRVAIVVTSGVSMNPVYYQGDLVVVAKVRLLRDRPDRRLPGTRQEDFVALHRIIAGDASGFTFKGDNNQSIDPYHPTADQIVGGAVLHIPHGGQVLQFLTNPIALGVVAFALIMFGSNRIRTRRERGERPWPNRSAPATV